MSGYQRAYRIAGFGSIGFVLMIFSVALSRTWGVTGLVLPWLLVGIAYLVVDVLLDWLIDVLELRAGLNDRWGRHSTAWRSQRGTRRNLMDEHWSNAGPVPETDDRERRRW